jgi:peroxiredoxin
MALRYSRMIELGAAAPDFALPDPSGKVHRLSDFADAPALLVAFICNHCKYVKHIREGFAAFAREYAGNGLAIVAISPNDAADYPEDSPANNARVAAEFGFVFPYLYDESQEIALAYEAICTPDFFLFDKDRRLVYRGRFDEASPGNGKPVTGADLRAAADSALAGRAPASQQHPSMGCSIKWKADIAPDWG